MAGVAKDARAVLTQAFTPGLIKLLQQDRSPHRFLSALFSPEAIRKPWSIWGPELLGQLKAWAQEETEAISEAARQRSRWPLWNSRDYLMDEGYRGQYPSLREELVVDNLFLEPILAGDMDLGGAKVGTLLEALEVSIQSSLNVIQHLAARPGENPGALRAQEVALTTKQDVFEALILTHPEFGWRKNRSLVARRR